MLSGPNFEGAKYVMSPPLRDQADTKPVLWNAPEEQGRLVPWQPITLPSIFVGQKEMGREDFTKIPNGIPSLEDRINLLLRAWRENQRD